MDAPVVVANASCEDDDIAAFCLFSVEEDKDFFSNELEVNIEVAEDFRVMSRLCLLEEEAVVVDR